MNSRDRAMARGYEDTSELEARMRALPLVVRRTFVVAVTVVAVPWSFFDVLAREWWFGLRMAVLVVKGDIAHARRVWRR